MPAIPVADNVIKLRPLDDTPQRAADYGPGIGQGPQSLAQGVGDVAQAQLHLDEAGAKQAFIQYTQFKNARLYTDDDALFNQTGANAMNAAAPVSKQLDDKLGEIEQGLTSKLQRRMFQDTVYQERQRDSIAIARHVHTQADVYNDQQDAGLQWQMGQDATAAAVRGDDEGFEIAKGTMINSIRDQARRKGLSGAPAQVAEEKAVSSLYGGIVEQKAIADPADAKAYLDAHRDEIKDSDLQLRLDKMLEGPLEAQQASHDVALAMGVPAPTMATRDATPVITNDAMTNTVATIESGGRQFRADGNPIVSPRGAIGKMQVMPETGPEAARLAGLPWNLDRLKSDTAYNAALGAAYFRKQLSDFGDPIMAAAAYNAGPGRVRDAIAKGGADWRSHLPSETKAYVTKFAAGTGGGAPAGKDDLGDIYGRIDRLSEQGGWTFERTERAKQEADRLVARDDRLVSRRQDAARDQALDTVTNLGDGFTSMAQLPPSTVENLSPETRLRLTDMARSNAKPKAIAANGDAALSLNLLAIANPREFLNTDLRLHRDQMTPGEFASLAETQVKLRANPQTGAAISHNRIWSMISTYGPDVGIDPKQAKKEGTAARQDSMRLFSMIEGDLARTTNGKREPTDDEIKAAFDRSVMTVKQPHNGWFSDAPVETARFRVPRGSLYQVSVPNPVRDRISASFQRTAGRAPTESEIAQTYINHRGQRGFWQ